MATSRTLKLATILVVTGLLAGSGGAAGASPARSPARGDADGTLEIGQLAPQTGDLANIVQSFTTPVTIAVDEINNGGGVLGQPVSYSLADDGTNPDVASESLKSLRRSNVEAVIGPASSGTMLGILDQVRRAGVLVCSGSNTSAELSTADSGGYYFRTAPPDTLQSRALAKLVLKDRHRKVGILARHDTYGVGLGAGLKTALTDGGAKVVADVSYDPDAKNFDSVVQKVARAKPDAVIVIGFDTDGADVVRTMIGQNLGPQQTAVYTADGMRSSGFGQLVDPNNPGVVAGMKGTSPAAAPAAVQSPFLEKFNATGVEPIFSSYYYDCTILTALAAEKAKSDDPAKMKKAFAANTRGRVKCNTYADCKKALDEKKTIQYVGASATFKNMNKFGAFEPTAGAYEVWSYDAGAKDVTQPDAQIRIG
jgi:branched-chain amino acid transport system substrate-binding protein